MDKVDNSPKSIIEGLQIIEDFITEDEEKELLKLINDENWSNSISRRTQHYGYKYNYNSKNAKQKATPIPDWEILKKVKKIMNFEQVIVNEYKSGQGIAYHIDRPSVFGDVIISLSLGSTYNMLFKKFGKVITQPLKRRSLLIIKGDARYKWMHSISRRKTDNIDGKRIPRGLRISITFRTMK